jgi:hypothetical protein
MAARSRARADAEEMLRLIESVFEDEPDVFTKRSFLLEMANSPEVGERVLELLERRPSARCSVSGTGVRPRRGPVPIVC